MTSPLNLVKSPQASLYTSLAMPSHIPERHPFSPVATTSPEKQRYNTFCISSPGVPVEYNESPAPHVGNTLKYDQSALPEPSKVYRKSPFLPRKTGSPDSTKGAKKESKLSTFGEFAINISYFKTPLLIPPIAGNSFLKNLTTSPFSQRKHSVPQPELPPMLVDKQRAPNIPSQHPQQHRPGEAAANSQLPKHIFQNSPLLQRRNPSYVTYGDCNTTPNRGRDSANTSPIGECTA